jgi:hypothetical protein
VIAASRRWRNLGIAAAATTAVMFALFDLYQWALAYAGDPFHNDFTFYYAAARIGLTHGWASIYDLGLQQAQLNAMGSGITIAQLARYISPPPVAWLALPLTVLPFHVAYWTWCALLVAALIAAWHLAAPPAGRARAIYLAAAVGWLPVIYGLQLGQPGLFVALGVAASCALLRNGRPFWAGVALAPLALKPQLAFLVPLALLAAGQRRAFVGSIAALGLLAAGSFAALGPQGLMTYLERLSFAGNVPVNRELTVYILVGPVTWPVQVVIAAWTLFMAYRLRRRRFERVYAIALVGGALATPYMHLDDLVMVGLAGLLVLRASPPAWAAAYMLAAVLAIEGQPIWGPLPVLVVEVGALTLLSVAALEHHDRDAEKDRAKGEHDARLERDREHLVADGQPEAVDAGQA